VKQFSSLQAKNRLFFIFWSIQLFHKNKKEPLQGVLKGLEKSWRRVLKTGFFYKILGFLLAKENVTLA